MPTGVRYAPWEKAFDRIVTPIDEFIHRQTTAGVLLMGCAIVALIIGNTGLYPLFSDLLHVKFSLNLGDWTFGLSIHHWINELLMAIFFLLIGLELKRELIVGELSSPAQALLPIVAAVGGMLFPALFYWALNTQGVTTSGWGIPMATDIAFAVGAVSLLGTRVPKSLVTFLIALAIVDDLGAVVVIALFYTDTINTTALAMAGVWTAVLVTLNLVGIRQPFIYAFVGIFLWSAMLSSGIHATIAGVVLAFTIPIQPKFKPATFLRRVDDLRQRMLASIEKDPDIIHNDEFRGLVFSMNTGTKLVQAPAQRAENSLHIPVTYLIIPLFALANACIPVSFDDPTELLGNPVTLGVLAGLLLGKPLGIFLMSFLAVKLGLATLPAGMRFGHVVGVGLLAGIGFTMAIFIGDLAFINHEDLLLQAKTGILFASLIAGLSGYLLLFKLGR